MSTIWVSGCKGNLSYVAAWAWECKWDGWRPLKAKQQEALQNVDLGRSYIRQLLVGFIRLAVAPSPLYDRKFFEDDLGAALQDEKTRRPLTAEFRN